VVLVDHTQSSQGFTGGLSVSVREAETRGGDEPGVHIRVTGAFSHKDHHVTPKDALGGVFSVDILWWFHNSDAFQAEY
jgi:hypothetical protein